MSRGNGEMFLRTVKWLRIIITTLLVFNAFQSIFIRVSGNNPDPMAIIRREGGILKNLYKKKQRVSGAVTEKVSFFTKKSINSEEKIKRHGILTLRPNAKGTVLICHGYTCNKFDITFLRTMFTNYNCLIFDFRAHGEENENQLCTLGKDEALDVIGAVEFVKNHSKLKFQKLFGYGFSMGAVSLIEAQAQKKLFDALILDCPFDSLETVISKELNDLRISVLGYHFNLPGKSIIKSLIFNFYTQPFIKTFTRAFGIDTSNINTRFELIKPLESIKKISIPCLFIHCKNDEKIPLKSVKKLFDKAKGFKNMWITNGRGHCDSFFFNPEKYKKVTNRFLQNVITKPFFRSKSQIIEDF
ncbi:alpha/beta hydrolase [Candidatus Babeliales bacterium]|nr:alpha/beta hydrolase [Candidatus Babeliales bacterium]